jgi:diacylglycerol kinase family enzyme
VSIGLGRVNGRRFAFSSGIGLDAEAVRRIDRRGRDGEGRRAGNAIFAATVAALFIQSRFTMAPQLELEGYGRAAWLFVANGRPYTYAGPVPVKIAGSADFGAGLDFVAPRAVGPASFPRLVIRGFRGTLSEDPRVIGAHDVDVLVVHCDRPLPLQADGEDLGDVTEARFEAERNALDVLL